MHPPRPCHTPAPEPPPARSFLSELVAYLTSRAAQYRQRYQYAPALDFEVAGNIATDATRTQAQIDQEAYRAEVHDLEAIERVRAAQQPDSDGGSAITPSEAAPIVRLITRSAESDALIGQLAKP